jgi:hypothetical protein
MTKFRLWFKSNAKTAFIAFLLGFVAAALTVPQPASALELNAAWRCRELGLASTEADTIRLAPLNGQVMSLPGAYMIWENTGNPISVRRFYNGVAETNWISIPTGQSIIIPAPPGYQIASEWTHVLAFKGAAGDTVKYLPMDR